MNKITHLSSQVTLIEYAPPVRKAEGFIEAFKMKGCLTLEHLKEDGSIDIHKHDNLIVNVGFDFICNVIGLPSQPTEMTHIGVGTGTTAAAAGNTALETALGARLAATYAHTTGTKIFTLSALFGAGVSTGAWTEAGCFNAVTAGIMLDRLVFSVVNKAAGDSITATFTFTLS